MSKLKSAELNASPFPYHAKPGDVFESKDSTNQYEITSVENGVVYWTKRDERVSNPAGVVNLP